MKKLSKLFYNTCLYLYRTTSKVIWSSHNPGFRHWKHTHMQISSKPVVQACDDLEIWMHTSKGEQIHFKLLFIQFRFVRQNLVKHSCDKRFDKFSQLISKVSLPGTITFMYKLDQVWTNNAQKNSLWQKGGLSFLHLKNYWSLIIFPQDQWKVRVSETDSNYVIWVNVQGRIERKIWSVQLLL